MRLNKYLALCGLGSRRKVEILIIQQKVYVNGGLATLSTQVNEFKDIVKVNGKQVSPQKFIYIALNKPLGVTSSTADIHARKLVTDLVPIKDRLFPIGRLDKNSSGLMLLTNDGNLAQNLAHPRYHFPKVYEVVLTGQLTAAKIQQIKNGVYLNGRLTMPAEVQPKDFRHGTSVIEITLYQGLKRQIRLMAAALHLHVDSLKRLEIGPIKLNGLKEGDWRYLTESELQKLNYSANSLKQQ